MRIMLIGFGAVGQNFATILCSKGEELLRSYGLKPRVVAILDSKGCLMDPKGIDLSSALRAKKSSGTLSLVGNGWHQGMTALDALEEVECEAVLELTPTNIVKGEPALSYIKAALKNGIHVITTNKGPIALALPALMELAAHNGVILRFSGTVGGGTPVLDLAKTCLSGNSIKSVRGILNGTTNYILTRMSEKHLSMEEALREAQKLGYAEADPSYDIDGIDTAAKLVIIANWVLGKELSFPEVKIEGIRKVTLEDIFAAEKDGMTIKLLGRVDGGVITVRPTRLAKSDPLNVGGPLNAVTFETELAGNITIVGQGSGGVETASAVLRDLLHVRRTFAR